MKNTLKLGVTVLVVAALTMSGIALAQTDDSTEDTFNENAVSRIVEKLQGLIDDGTISADQAQAVAETLADGFRPGGPRGHRGVHVLGGVAEFLEMEPEDFREALGEYETLADLAAANGSSGDELIEYLVTKAEEHLAQAVDNDRIDQATADEKLAEIEERVTEMVNGEIPEFQGRPGPGRGGGGPFGDQPPAEEAGLST